MSEAPSCSHPGPHYSPCLLTDLYELTMLEGYFTERMSDVAVFSLIVRRLPRRRNYLLACGLDGITHLFVGGLATDYCVRHSVLDALQAGFRVTILEDAIAGIDAREGDSARALAEMRARGARIVRGPLPPPH